MSSLTVQLFESISDAIDSLQAGDDRGAVVVDSRYHVVGIITEGDIVRALRQGVLPEALVANVATGRVRLATVPLSDEELAHEFIVYGTLLIPVVDKVRRLLYVQRTREAVSRLLDQGDAS